MSLTRFLLYSNQFDVQGICATTSIWLQNQTRIDQIQGHIAEYAKIYDNLSAHQPDTEGKPTQSRIDLQLIRLRTLADRGRALCKDVYWTTIIRTGSSRRGSFE